MKKIFWIVPSVVVAVAFAGYIAAGPFLAIKSIKESVRARDYQKLSQHIDFEKVRTNFKASMIEQVDKVKVRIQDNPSDTAMLDSMTKIMEEAVDKMITPENAVNALAEEFSDKPQEQSGNLKLAETKEKYGFDSINKFSINRTFHGKEVEIILTRKGLSWHVTSVVMKPDPRFGK